MDLMSQWVEEAAAADPEDYNAMCIATQSLAGESTVGLFASGVGSGWPSLFHQL